MAESEAEFRRKLEDVHRAYVERLPERLTEIEAGWSAVSREADLEALEPLHRATHSLIGSAGTFGYDHLSQAARRVERFLKSLSSDRRLPSPDETSQGEALLEELRAVLLSVGHVSVAAAPSEDQAPQGETYVVYLLDREPDLEAELAPQLPRFGYRVERLTEAGGLRQALEAEPPAAVLISLCEAGSMEQPTGVTEALGPELIGTVPLMFVAPRDELPLRLASVRAGAQMFYARPVDVRALVSRLDVLTQRHHPDPFRVLLVDDEPELAEHYAVVLTQAGMQAEVVSHWEQLMPVLARFRPEMIIMDIYMPDYSGLDLASAIRQDERYLATPILFLSSETDEGRQLAALGLGGDGFLTKPVSDAHLINAVAARMQRSRLLNAAVSRDALTGLLNHARLKELLGIELARMQRHGGELTFAMLDIDHFKQINDRRGHMVGDQVILALARLLQERLRRSDAVGRYGGEEFALILPDADLDDARHVLEEIRTAFAAMSHGDANAPFQVTLSAGVASSADHEEVDTLIRAADRALYDAKGTGRNKVVVDGD
ncbi:MAG: diguanylate cyclase [Chromatiales bacterium]